MGFWLKCPGCQSDNPLDLKVCPHCGRSLENLPRQERVYVIGALAAAAPVAKPAAQRAAATPRTPRPAKRPPKPRGKKSHGDGS
jgi:hypothetical protein